MEQEQSKQGWGDEQAGLDDPLLESLLFFAKKGGNSVTADSLRAGLPLINYRITPDLFVRAASRIGFSARLVRRKVDQIPSLVLPVVLLLENHRAVILTGIDRDRGFAEIIQPESGGGQKISLDELNEVYTDKAFFLSKQYQFDDAAPELFAEGKQRHWFWGTLQQSWRIYRDVLIASFIINLFALTSPLFVMNVYDRVVPNNAIETLWVLAIGAVLIYLFDLVMRLLRSFFVDMAGKKSDVLLSAAIFEQVMGMKMAVMPPSIGGFANNLREFESVRDFITSASVSALVDLPFVILFLVVISIFAGNLVLIPIVAILIIVLYGVMIQRRLRYLAANSSRALMHKNATLIESLSGIESIKALGAEGFLQRKWEHSVSTIAEWGVRSRLMAASATSITVFMQQLATVSMVVGGVYQISEGNLSMGGLIAVVMLTSRTLGPMGQVVGLTNRYQQAKAAYLTLSSIMKQPVERSKQHNYVHRDVMRGDIRLKNVSFSYPDQELKSLSDVNIHIKNGEHVGILGRVGSGKTTVLKVILGLYEPDEGVVHISEGTDLRQIDPIELRKNIGYVPQDISLFFGNLRENIIFGAPHTTDDEMLKAARFAGISNFADGHPMGYELPVGERGSKLSGGQRQGIALARAALLNPPIMLLDEPTSSMDNTSEAQMKKRLKEFSKDKTMIVVTHRASLLDIVDRLIIMERGKVIADGPKDEVKEILRKRKLNVQ